MTTVEEFFEANAASFSCGDLEAAADTLRLPAVIHVGKRKIDVRDRDVLIATLHTYRTNLLVESYAYTTAHVQHCTQEGNAPQAFVLWQNFNDQGAEISRFEAAYILEREEDGRLVCITAEILPPLKERLVQGLPLA